MDLWKSIDARRARLLGILLVSAVGGCASTVPVIKADNAIREAICQSIAGIDAKSSIQSITVKATVAVGQELDVATGTWIPVAVTGKGTHTTTTEIDYALNRPANGDFNTLAQCSTKGQAPTKKLFLDLDTNSLMVK